MSMIDIFKDTLQKGMVITNCKELSNRYKITLMYEGMEGTCELNKMCAPNSERALCRKAIDTAISGMYINIGNLLEAKAWLDGERWTVKEIGDESKCISIAFTEKELEQVKYALEYLHDADVADLGYENIKAMERAMTKLKIKFESRL